MILETTARPSKIERRQQLKQAVFAWLSQQPNGMALEAEFRNKVGRMSDVHALLSSRDFAVFEIKGEKWVSAQIFQDAEFEAGRKESTQAIKLHRIQLRQDTLGWLAGRPDQMATINEFRQKFGADGDADSILAGDDFVSFDYQGNRWLQPTEYHETIFRKKMVRQKAAKAQRAESDLAWQDCIPLSGEVMRPDGTHGKSARLVVIARTHTLESAAKRLGFANGVLRIAAASGDVPSFTDPDGKTRIPAAAVEQAAASEEMLEKIGGNTRLTARQISIVTGVADSDHPHPSAGSAHQYDRPAVEAGPRPVGLAGQPERIQRASDGALPGLDSNRSWETGPIRRPGTCPKMNLSRPGPRRARKPTGSGNS